MAAQRRAEPVSLPHHRGNVGVRVGERLPPALPVRQQAKRRDLGGRGDAAEIAGEAADRGDPARAHGRHHLAFPRLDPGRRGGDGHRGLPVLVQPQQLSGQSVPKPVRTHRRQPVPNGRRLPPWLAVAGLGRLAQADAEHLRVLWESAAHAWSREHSTGAPHPAQPRLARQDAPRTRPTPRLLRMSAPHRRCTGCPDETLGGHAGVYWWLPVRPVCCWPPSCSPNRGARGRRSTARRTAAPSGVPAWPWPLQRAEERVAVGCRLAGCRGLDPFRERCDRDSVVVHRLRAYGHVLTLQYSPACRASWAEVETPPATAGLRIATTGGDQQVAVAGGAYTAMVGGGRTRRVPRLSSTATNWVSLGTTAGSTPLAAAGERDGVRAQSVEPAGVVDLVGALRVQAKRKSVAFTLIYQPPARGDDALRRCAPRRRPDYPVRGQMMVALPDAGGGGRLVVRAGDTGGRGVTVGPQHTLPQADQVAGPATADGRLRAAGSPPATTTPSCGPSDRWPAGSTAPRLASCSIEARSEPRLLAAAAADAERWRRATESERPAGVGEPGLDLVGGQHPGQLGRPREHREEPVGVPTARVHRLVQYE